MYASEVQTLTMQALGARRLRRVGRRPQRSHAGQAAGPRVRPCQLRQQRVRERRAVRDRHVTLWPRTIALVANAKAFAALSPEQQGWLRQAAADATAYSLKLPNTEQQKLNVACRLGARAVIATPGDLAALTKALAPVYTTIQRNANTKTFVHAIRALKRKAPARPLTVPAGCATRAS